MVLLKPGLIKSLVVFLTNDLSIQGTKFGFASERPCVEHAYCLKAFSRSVAATIPKPNPLLVASGHVKSKPGTTRARS